MSTLQQANCPVYIGMTADILHHGHINIIEKAREYGDITIGLLTDAALTQHRRLPFLNYEQRARILGNLRGVKRIVPQQEWDYSFNLRKYRPAIMVHGDDWCAGNLRYIRERAFAAMSEWGGKIIEIPYTQDISSHSLREKIRSLGTTPDIRRATLSRLLRTRHIVRACEVHNPLSALIVERAAHECPNGNTRRFDAMWASSLTDSVSRGKPDIEAVAPATRLDTVGEIFEVTNCPLIYDADTGGQQEHFAFNVRSMERLGISAVIIEDKTGLKKNSLLGLEVPQQQESIEGFCQKISTAIRARVTSDFMLIARIESLILEKGMEDALARAKAYVRAGVDGIMIHSRRDSADEVLEFARQFQKFSSEIPLIAVPTSYSQTTESELAQAGFRIVIYANHLLRAAYPAMLEAARSILAHGRAKEADQNYCMQIKDILELIPGTR